MGFAGSHDEFGWTRLSNLRGLLVAAYRRILDSYVGSSRIQIEKPQRARSLSDWTSCGNWHFAWQVPLGIQSHNLRRHHTLVIASLWNAWPGHEQPGRPLILTRKNLKNS